MFAEGMSGEGKCIASMNIRFALVLGSPSILTLVIDPLY